MKCSVIKDLLVPYLDQTCSDETKKIVEDHISECEGCRNELEQYKTKLIIDTPKTDGKVIKPFRKIKLRIISLIIIILFLIAIFIVCGSYIAKGKSSDWYEADKAYFNISDSDIYGGIQKSGIERKIAAIYGKLYFKIIDKEKYYTKKASYNEIANKCKEIQSVRFDYENMEIHYDSLSNSISVYIPMTAEGDSVMMGVTFYGTRTGIGKYYFYEYVIYRDDMLDLGYSYQSSIALHDDELMAWPARDSFINIYVNAFDRITPSHESFFDMIPEDTGKKLAAGVYRFADGDNWDEFTIYPDGTFTRERSYGEDNKNNIILEIHKVTNPTRYCITSYGKNEFFTILSSTNLGISISGKDIRINDDGSFYIFNTLYEKIS